MQYPFGAGQGRWGMMNYYFGTPDPAIWSEIMWTSWLYDGGILLIIANIAALAIAMRIAWKIGTDISTPHASVYGVMILAYNVAGLAATFVYPVFCRQDGMDLWLLNACAYAAWRGTKAPRVARNTCSQSLGDYQTRAGIACA
jgi:hypothetical protein